MMKADDLSESIIAAVVHSDLSQVSVAIAEVGLDTFLDEGVLRDIPLVGTVVSIVRSGCAIRDKLFIRKLGMFLLSLSDIPQAKKEAFARKLDAAPEFRRKVGDNLILLLERLDDFEKPQLLADAFKAYVRGDISYADFRRLSSAIDIAFIDDLRALTAAEPTSDDLLHRLIRTGLAETARSTPTTLGGIRIGAVLSELGRLYIEVLGAC